MVTVDSTFSAQKQVSSSKLQRALSWWLTPRSIGDEEQFREKTVRGIVLIFSFISLVLFSIISITDIIGIASPAIGTYITFGVLGLIMGSVAYLVYSNKVETSTIVLISALLLLSLWLSRLSPYWLVTPSLILMVTFALGMLLLPRRYFYHFVIGAILVMLIMPLLARETYLADINNPDITPNIIYDPWIFRLLIIGITVMLASLFRYYINEFNRRHQALDHLVQTLEDRVTQRTRDLEVAAQVSTQITTVLDHHELLPQIVNLTQQSFNLYQVSIYLFDSETNILKYEAGTGEASRSMKERGKQFILNEQGLVPYAGLSKLPQRVDDVRLSPNYFQEKTLPNTRSELAVPMVVGETLIGVLDLQSEDVGYFTDDDLVVMQQLAKQVAIAVQNAQLYAYQLEVAEQLRAVDELKSQFLASMSHELRTPLNAILNFSKFINMGIYGDVTEKQVDAMTKIIGSAQHLLSLINDVLDITKIESGMMQLFVEDNIDLHKEIDPVVTTAETLLSEKEEVNFIKDIDQELPSIVGDKRRVRQILLNLVSNACKFTETGSVTLSVKAKTDKILFAVIDTGPGIPADKLDIIFEPFQQTETGVKHAGGTGLGLPISKKLAEAHGGRLWVDTTVGEGSAFYAEIPMRSVKLLQELETSTPDNKQVEA